MPPDRLELHLLRIGLFLSAFLWIPAIFQFQDALGAHFLSSNVRTILDIGGQDSKAIRVDPGTGKVAAFVMNDKCAAGTGRFLEKVAGLLELTIDDLGRSSARSLVMSPSLNISTELRTMPRAFILPASDACVAC